MGIMNIIKKRERLIQHLTEEFSANELAEMIVSDYTNDEIIENCNELFEED